jgi:hypothetical protein
MPELCCLHALAIALGALIGIVDCFEVGEMKRRPAGGNRRLSFFLVKREGPGSLRAVRIRKSSPKWCGRSKGEIPFTLRIR